MNGIMKCSRNSSLCIWAAVKLTPGPKHMIELLMWVFEILNWRDSTSVDGSLVNWGLILNVLIVVMVTDGVVREIPVCEGVF